LFVTWNLPAGEADRASPIHSLQLSNLRSHRLAMPVAAANYAF
jgi:hypothetical protein